MAKQTNEGFQGDLIVGLDLGTSKTCCLIAETDAEDGLHLIGVGNVPSIGLKKGAVINIEATVDSMRKALGEAQRMAGVEVRSAFFGVGGEHIRGMTSHGVIAVGRKDKEVTEDDVERVLEAAKAIAIPQDREIIHVLTQEYMIDNQDGIREPVGMSGVRLEAKVHVITGAVTSVQNILKSADRAGLGVDDLILQPLASAAAVLTADEKELGVALVDIGGGTTDLVVMMEGAVRHTGVVPVGGAQFTRDLAIGLRTPNEDAEDIKRKYGCVRADLLVDGDEIPVAGVGGRAQRSMPRRSVAEILQPRAEELLGLVAAELKKSGFEGKLAAGYVLTGGSSQIAGLRELAEDMLGAQVSLGKPQALQGLGDVVQAPEYATAVGLLLEGKRLRSQGGGTRVTKAEPAQPGGGVANKVKNFFKEYF
ncbi:MAG: cell division protein FtsA [candidate division FCPU426 bacterium]